MKLTAMKFTRRAFNRGGAAVAAAALLPVAVRAETVPPRDEALVLARATGVDLSAQETAVVLAPVPPPPAGAKAQARKGRETGGAAHLDRDVGRGRGRSHARL